MAARWIEPDLSSVDQYCSDIQHFIISFYSKTDGITFFLLLHKSSKLVVKFCLNGINTKDHISLS